MNTYNFPSIGVVAFVILVFVSVGVLGYYAYDVTTKYNEVMDDLAVLQNQVDTLKNENETLKRVNADMTNRNNGLVLENDTLRSENTTLTAQLQACQLQSNFAPAGTMKSTMLPTDPRAAIVLALLLVAAVLAGVFSFSHWHGTHSDTLTTYSHHRNR